MLTRRALIVRGGTAGAGVVFLWPGRAEAAPSVLATTKSIPVGGGRIIKGKYVITQPKKGVYRCFSAICTHQGCAVGSVSRGAINCPCHGSKFSASTGAVLNGPAKQPLPRKKIKVSKGKIRLA
jgi:Rieske Fe-S protein